MNFLRTFGHWMGQAWRDVLGLSGPLNQAYRDIWHGIQAHWNVLQWLYGIPQLGFLSRAVEQMGTITRSTESLANTVQRIGPWIWLYVVKPRVDALLADIAALRAWVAYQIHIVYVVMGLLYQAARAYTRQLVGIEHQQMVQAVAAEHQAMVQRVTWALAQVQLEASSGYNTGRDDRKNLVQKLAGIIADHNPIVKGLIGDLVSLVIDLDTIDNPLIRWTIGKLVSTIIGHLGIDQVAGQLLSDLLGPLAGDPKPATLYDVCRDIASRLNALEAQWTAFMDDGGPDVEQAGRDWKELSSVLVDGALVGIFALAVTDPAAFAAGVADSVGLVGNDALTGIVDLLHHA